MGFSKKNKAQMIYPNVPSAIRPVRHNDALPIPKAPDTYNLDDPDVLMNEATPEVETGPSLRDEDYSSDVEEPQTGQERALHPMTQVELSDIIQDLDLPKC
jgi:hypothetical protein